MGLTYYDDAERRQRLKRRYAWGIWGFGAGVLAGVALSWIIR
jgi:hypothetical protein